MKITAFVCALFIITSAYAQSYEVPASGSSIGWHMGFDLKSITVEPTGIVVHTTYHNKYQTRTLTIPQNLTLYIPSIYRSIPVTSIVGAGFGTYTMKSGKRYSIDFICPFNWNELIRYSDNALFIMNILNMRLTTNQDFTEPQAVYASSDWRFDFSLPLTIEQQLTLGCAAYLSGLTVKNEFETTAGYNARLHPDSVKTKIMDEMQQLLNIVTRPDVAKLKLLKPQLTYSADEEVFTLNYASNLAGPVKIKVPIAKAKALKEGYASGQFTISIESITLTREGNYFINSVKFYNTKEKQAQIFSNLLAPAQPQNLQWLADNVFKELSKKHPNGKLLKS